MDRLSKSFPVFDCDAHINDPTQIWDYVPESKREWEDAKDDVVTRNVKAALKDRGEDKHVDVSVRNGVVRLSLEASTSFVSDISTGNLISLFLTATTNSTVGFTFHSRNFIDPTQFPFLEITAVPIPPIILIMLLHH